MQTTPMKNPLIQLYPGVIPSSLLFTEQGTFISLCLFSLHASQAPLPKWKLYWIIDEVL